jgi:hypothetical protein
MLWLVAARTFRLLLIPLLLALGACSPGVRPAELQRYVAYLSSDKLAGRELDSPGIAEAERYIAERFRSYGLSPLPGKRSFFQEFTLYQDGFDAAGTALRLRLGAAELTGTAGRDFRPFPFSAQGEQSAPVVFTGYGITAPEYGYDDYQGLEVHGKFVLVLRHEPGSGDARGRFEGAAHSRHSYFTNKARNARRRGAVGMILVNDPLTAGQDEDLRLIRSFSLEPFPPVKQQASGNAFLAVHIGAGLAEAMIRETGLDLAGLQKAVDGGRLPKDIPLGEVHADIRVTRMEGGQVTARNVVGFLEGADPRLKREWIVIGAHHDHLGSYVGSGDTIYNGADDNASGVSGVLALARLFARKGAWAEERSGRWKLLEGRRPPGRSLVFATFSAEEQGLFGSRVLADELLQAGDHRVVFMFNLDMIGRNPDRPIEVFGDGFPQDVRRIVELAAGEALPLRFTGSSRENGSDQLSFSSQGVPFLFFFTGLHSDYHGPDDEADRLSYPRAAAVVNLAWRVASAIAGEAHPHVQRQLIH